MQTASHSEFLHTLIALGLVSVASFIGSATFALGRRLQAAIPYLIGAAAGALLGTALYGLLPEAVQRSGQSKRLGLLLTIGFLFCFLLERLLGLTFECNHTETGYAMGVAAADFTNLHHSHELKRSNDKSLVANILLSGAVHSLVDGIGIAVAFSTSHTAGVATTTAVLLHEVPHHIADIGVIISSGISKTRAILLNFLATTGCATGGVMVLLFGLRGDWITSTLLPLTAANFLYIAVGMLMPELQKEKNRVRSAFQVVALILTLALVGTIGQLIPENRKPNDAMKNALNYAAKSHEQ